MEASCSTVDPMEESEEYEETTFAAELHGIVDVDYVEEMIEKEMCFVHKLETDEPVIQVGSHLFVAKWEKLVGTDLIFSELSHRHLLNFVGRSDKRLSARQVLLVPKDSASGVELKSEKNKKTESGDATTNENS